MKILKFLKFIPHPHNRKFNFMWKNTRGEVSIGENARHSYVSFIRTCKLCGKVIDNGWRRGY